MTKRFLRARGGIAFLLVILLSLCLALGAGFALSVAAYADGDSEQTEESGDETKTANEWETEPRMTAVTVTEGVEGTAPVGGWAQGLFDSSVYFFEAKAKYADEQTYFKIYKETENDALMPVSFSQGVTVGAETDNTAFRTDNGVVAEYVVQTLNGLDAGSYVLLGCVPETEDYYGLNASDLLDDEIIERGYALEIGEQIAIKNLSVEQWVWGEYNYLENVITAEVTGGSAEDVSYTVSLYNDGVAGAPVANLRGFKTNADGAVVEQEASDALRRLNAGEYLLTASILGSDNKEVTKTLVFRVREFENDWQKTPAVISWVWGSYDKDVNKISGKALKSDSGIVYYGIYVDSNTPYSETLKQFTVSEDGTVPDEVAKELEALGAGDYFLRCTTKDDNPNYTDLSDTFGFTIAKLQNVWEEIPSVIGWNEGHYDVKENVLNGSAKIGKVTFTVLDENGNLLYTVVKNENGTVESVTNANGDSVHISLLNKLAVGKYELVAEVSETENHTGLKNSITFVVSEDSVALGGIIAATIVFGIFDLIAAGTCIALLVIRRKKVEKQFRKMVRKELNRR